MSVIQAQMQVVIPAGGIMRSMRPQSRDPGEKTMKDHTYFIYIIASRKNGTLYVGVTNQLLRRVQQHRERLVPGFTKKYGVKILVYFEVHNDINEAIAREKRLKHWRRSWKLELIEKKNPEWRDLWPELAEHTP